MYVDFQTNLHSTIVEIGGVFQSLMPRINARLKRNIPKYRAMAKSIAETVVYSHPENPKYPRTYDLLLSIDVQKIEDGVIIFNNPKMATRNRDFPNLQSYAYLKGKAQAGYRYYPAFVLQGNFFGQQQSPRNYLDVWSRQLSREIVQDIKEM